MAARPGPAGAAGPGQASPGQASPGQASPGQASPVAASPRGAPSAAAPLTPAADVRARARADMRRTILDAARARLAAEGAAALSLRAVARDVGLASSAVYRYVESRDALLTALIIEAYDSLGTAAETAEAGVPRDDLTDRWLAIARAVRQWALARPHEYALVYGTPVPGYAAPQDTVGPATRVARLLAALLADVHERGLAREQPPVSDEVEAAVTPVRAYLPAEMPAGLVVVAVGAQAHLFGAVSFELFGQRRSVVADDLLAVFFDEEMRHVARTMWHTEPQERP